VELEKAKAIAEEIKRMLPNIEHRFWPKVIKSDDGDGCWLWKGAKVKDGYGSIKVGQHALGAHRIAYLIQVGDIPLGASVLHSCDNPACVRPSHLFLGTQQDNMTDMILKGRGNKATGDRNASRLYPEKRPRGDTHAFRLHPELCARGEKVANAKLKEGQVKEIRRRWKAGEASQHALAREYG